MTNEPVVPLIMKSQQYRTPKQGRGGIRHELLACCNELGLKSLSLLISRSTQFNHSGLERYVSLVLDLISLSQKRHSNKMPLCTCYAAGLAPDTFSNLMVIKYHGSVIDNHYDYSSALLSQFLLTIINVVLESFLITLPSQPCKIYSFSIF